MKKPTEAEVHDAVRTMLAWAGDDPSREGLIETPKRVAEAYKEFFAGYETDPEEILEKTFEEVEGYDEMVLVKDIRVESHCEHHMLPIIGKAHVAYISKGKVIGLSKINRLVDYYSRRPQVQERLTLQIADAISDAMNTEDVAVYIDSKHLCVSMRGIKDHASSTITSEFRGAFRDKDTQQKFIDFIRTPSE